jgi:hypothetical protein
MIIDKMTKLTFYNNNEHINIFIILKTKLRASYKTIDLRVSFKVSFNSLLLIKRRMLTYSLKAQVNVSNVEICLWNPCYEFNLFYF